MPMSYKKSGQFPASHKGLAALLKQYDIDSFSYYAAKSGIENATFVVAANDEKRFVLRIYRQNRKTDREMVRELEFMERLRAKELPVPKVYKNIRGANITEIELEGTAWKAILMEFKPGFHAKNYSRKVIELLAKFQAAMHLEGLEFAKSLNDTKALKYLAETEFTHLITEEKLKDQKRAAFIERAKKFRYDFDHSLPCGYSHFDYDVENILVDDSDNITGILDFDDMQYAPVVMCLAYTLWTVLLAEDNQAVKKYIDAYEQTRQLSREERKAIAPIMLFRHYVIGSLCVLRDEMSDEDLQTFLRLEKFLKTADYSQIGTQKNRP